MVVVALAVFVHGGRLRLFGTPLSTHVLSPRGSRFRRMRLVMMFVLVHFVFTRLRDKADSTALLLLRLTRPSQQFCPAACPCRTRSRFHRPSWA